MSTSMYKRPTLSSFVITGVVGCAWALNALGQESSSDLEIIRRLDVYSSSFWDDVHSLDRLEQDQFAFVAICDALGNASL